MTEASRRSDPAFHALALDIVTKTLSMASNPSELGDYICDEMRELTGARTIGVLQCRHETSDDDHVVVSVKPLRRRAIVESPQVAGLAQASHKLKTITFWKPGTGDDIDAEKKLTELGIGLSMAVPLTVGEFQVGVLLLFDLPTDQHLKKVVELLDMLSTVVALILRNSFLYSEQENIIQNRTEELQDSRERYRNLFQSAGEAVFVARASDDRIIDANFRCTELLGYTHEEIINMTLWDLHTPREQDHAREIREKILKTGSVSGVEAFHYRHKDGRDVPVSIIAAVIKLTGQTVVMVHVRDITKRRQIEHERQQLLKTLETKNKELQSIVYVASHDLRSPLVNIQGFAGELSGQCAMLKKLLDHETVPDQIRKDVQKYIDHEIPESLEFICAGTYKMEMLIDGLLHVSRVGSAVLVIRPLNMNKLIRIVVEALQFQLQEKSVSIQVQQLPDCKGDLVQINQVFSNLVDNAIKYMDPARPGSITVSGRITNRRSIYCVEDNGVGIVPEHQNKIFELFHRLEPGGDASGEGLGLTIVSRILERNNGTITVESQQDKGSKFFVSLPTPDDEEN